MAEPQPSEITSRPPRIDFTKEGVLPPSALYIDRDDRLYIRSFSRATTLKTVTIRGDLLHADGIIRPFEFVHLNAVDQTPQFQVFTLAEGFLLKCSVTATAAALHYGTIAVEVGILRGRAVDGQQQYSLISGYPEIGRRLSYPPSWTDPTADRHGTLTLFATTDPAAGAQASQTVPANELWRLSTAYATYVTDATVANRQPRLEIVRGGILVWRSREHDPQTAGQTLTYNWTLGGFHFATSLNSQHHNFLPDLYLLGGDVIRTAVTGGVAGDDWSLMLGAIEIWMRQPVP